MSSSGYFSSGVPVPVPWLVAEERVVLRVDAERLVVQHAHRIGGAPPCFDLVVGEAGGGDERRDAVGVVRRTSMSTVSAANRSVNRAITFVYTLSSTTAVYSSGPVTPWMWKRGGSVRS